VAREGAGREREGRGRERERERERESERERVFPIVVQEAIITRIYNLYNSFF